MYVLINTLLAQKNEIEKIIQELLEVGVICPNTSPLLITSSHGVKEGTRGMCHDFRVVNKLTIKDKFLIPIIDDLLDELHGAKFFTKVDLHLGYHQIMMKETNIPKTTFKTYEGRYEFLVIPFNLFNSPSTFLSLMNKISKPFLCNFVLVLFDDILIYSKSWESDKIMLTSPCNS
jgi:hypothetical protein